MNEDQHDSPPTNAMDRALMDYLDDILGDASLGRSRAPVVKHDSVKTDNVKPLEVVRPPRITAESHSQPMKAEPKQSVTLPFRTAEKPRVLSSLNLLNLNPAPAAEPVKPTPALKPVISSPPVIPPAEPIPITEKSPRIHSAPNPIPDATEKNRAPIPAPDLLPTDTVTDEQAEKLPPVEEWCDNGRPVWAQERFECLIFNVAGLKLAVPLMTLGAIHRIDRKFNALPHQSDWFIGILQTSAAGNIKVLDTALCVMPERHDPAMRETLAYVITIHGYTWGLACHEVERSITLEPDQVKWRTQRGKRPWLAGTVIDHMCALIDTDGFRDVILKAEKPR